jgi:Protein of unknown function (DUF2510)
MSPVSVPAGWYEDPVDGSQLRFWDGNAWTAQMTPAAAPPFAAPVTQQFGQQFGQQFATQAVLDPVTSPPGVAQLPRHKRPLSPRVVVSSIAAAAVIAGGVVWGASATSGNNYPPGCVTPVPAGAASAAVAYVNALNAASPAWSYADAHSRGLSTDRIKALRGQADADATFVKHLKRIDFGALDEEADGPKLIDLVTQYRDNILQDIKQPNLEGLNAIKNASLLSQRQQISTELRSELGLPEGVCVYNRPE